MIVMSTKIIKGLVSKKKKRYQKDGFDLDLSYICGNVIAMGFPGDRIEAFYRNNIDEVFRFLEAKHPERYKIYNLCSERSYDPQRFKGRVAHFPFKDHNPPSLSIIPRFCSDVQNWLKSNSDNVAVVHCKAGKGRTGVMICCYLLHSNQVSTANEALSYYAQERTKDSKGVTIPSQRRYVEYYERILKTPCRQYVQRPVLLREITLDGTISTTGTISIVITQSGIEDYKYSNGQGGIDWKKTGAPLTIVLSEPLTLSGDVKVELFLMKVMKQKLFHFWFNTFFLDKDSNFETEVPSPSVSSINRTTTRLILQETPSVRSSSDNVRELERTLSCPPPLDLHHHAPVADQWARPESISDESKNIPVPSMHLYFQKSHLDKPHKHLITSKSDFRISMSFSNLDGDENNTDTGNATSPARCFRSKSDTNTAHSTPLRYSSSSSSSSCTDDELSSDGSGGSTGALVSDREGKQYKL